MHRARRSAGHLITLVALATLAVTSCGVEPGASAPDGVAGSTATSAPGDDRTTTSSDDDPVARTDPSPSGKTTTTTEVDSERSAVEQEMVDGVAQTYEDLGLPPEGARCLADAIVDAQTSGEVVDQLDAMGYFTDCGLAMEDILAMAETLGDSPEDALRTSMITGMVNAGMGDEDAACVADTYLEEYGATDMTSFQDLAVQVELYQACDVVFPD